MFDIFKSEKYRKIKKLSKVAFSNKQNNHEEKMEALCELAKILGLE